VDVRFGSQVDICGATSHVRFTPNSDRESRHLSRGMSALPLKADVCSATAHVCFGPKADSCSAAKYRRRPLPSAQKAHEVAELLHRRALYRVYAELRVLLTNLNGRLKCWGIECCLRLLKVFKSEQDYALGRLAFD
jgi:hypothetical protein